MKAHYLPRSYIKRLSFEEHDDVFSVYSHGVKNWHLEGKKPHVPNQIKDVAYITNLYYSNPDDKSQRELETVYGKLEDSWASKLVNPSDFIDGSKLSADAASFLAHQAHRTPAIVQGLQEAVGLRNYLFNPNSKLDAVEAKSIALDHVYGAAEHNKVYFSNAKAMLFKVSDYREFILSDLGITWYGLDSNLIGFKPQSPWIGTIPVSPRELLVFTNMSQMIIPKRLGYPNIADWHNLDTLQLSYKSSFSNSPLTEYKKELAVLRGENLDRYNNAEVVLMTTGASQDLNDAFPNVTYSLNKSGFRTLSLDGYFAASVIYGEQLLTYALQKMFPKLKKHGNSLHEVALVCKKHGVFNIEFSLETGDLFVYTSYGSAPMSMKDFLTILNV